MTTCTKPPSGWTCSREEGHEGPCAASPVDEQRAPDMQAMVRDFMEACDQVIGPQPGLRDQLLRIRLILEEPTETAKAIYGNDLLEAIDGLCDSLYVILGTAVAFGVDIYPFFAEVHRSNMAKRHPDTGKVLKDLFGKVIKPAGWTPPDIEGVFRDLYGDPAGFLPERQSHDDKWHEVFRMAEHNGWGPDTIMGWMEERSSKGRDKTYG